jgi:hypothetical protein
LSSLNKPRKPQEKLLFIGCRIAVYKLHLASQPAVGYVETEFWTLTMIGKFRDLDMG